MTLSRKPVAGERHWAMDALHKLRFFQGGFGDILPNLCVLLSLAAVLTVVAGRTFKIRD